MALLHQPDHRYWIIFDDRTLRESPPIVVGWTRDQMRTAFDRAGPALLSGTTIAALAHKAGIDGQGLEKAVAGYNYGVLTGNDFLGRVHLPRPIADPPFHAIPHAGEFDFQHNRARRR